MTNGWPLWRYDHPLYYHSALVTRAFLKDSWTTAGYDPFFMAGYAKSVVFPSSSTLPELAIALFGGDHPELAYKLYVLVSAAAVPWLIALACTSGECPPAERRSPCSCARSTSGPTFRSAMWQCGMLPYFLGIPLALVGHRRLRAVPRSRGGDQLAAGGLAAESAFLVHLTTAMVVAPAAAMAYIARTTRQGT